MSERGEAKDEENVFERLIAEPNSNKVLAKLMKAADITKKISYHQVRHTFPTMLLSKGVPIESVSKMFGHTNIKTTQIYARITNKKIKADMMQVADKFNGFKDYFKG